MGDHSKKKKGKKDKRKDDKDRNNDNANQQIKDNTPVDTFYAQCHDISLNTDWVGVNTTSYLGLPPPPPIIPGAGAEALWLALNNNYLDSSGFGNTVTSTIAANNAPAFGTPGKFGSHYGLLNWPNISTPATPDKLVVNDASSNLVLDNTNGFSFSLWIQPKAVSALSADRFVFGKNNTGTTNGPYVQLYITTAGELACKYFDTTIGNLTKLHTGSLVNSTWYHVVITCNPTGGVLNLYKDKIASANTGGGTGFVELSIPIHIGFRSNNPAGTYYQGYIDEFKYYAGLILTQTQVNNLFATNAT